MLARDWGDFGVDGVVVVRRCDVEAAGVEICECDIARTHVARE